MRRLYWFFLTVTVLLAVAALAGPLGKQRMRNMPIVGGATEVGNVPFTPTHGNPSGRLDDPIGIVRSAGTTYYDYQHNGTAGKMIGVDDDGFVHLVWMNGTTAIFTGPRQINYQVWDPTLDSMYFRNSGQPSGVQVNSSTRAGYACMTLLPSGWAFPSFHETRTPITGNHAAAAMDFNARLGAFTSTWPDYCLTPIHFGTPGDAWGQFIWPKVSIRAQDSTIHMATCWTDLAGTAGLPAPVAYSRGHATWDDQGNGIQIAWDTLDCHGFQFLDTVKVIAQEIVASQLPTSNRVAYIYAKSRDVPIDSATQYNNDLYMQISEDGGHNWGRRLNITRFAEPDWNCASGDSLVCDRDTFRVYEDCNALFDMSDNLHVAFTTSYYYSLEGLISPTFSDVWHWDERSDEYSPICHGHFDSTNWSAPPGAWQRVAQRPSLCLDRTTGFLYCSIWYYDSLDYSTGGWPQGEALVSMSRNCGRTWSQPVDVTRTHPAVVPTPAGQCMSERDITLSDYVSYVDGTGYLNMEYVYDLDAGGIPQNEGTATLNPVKYQRIPIDSIPPLPLNDWTFPALHYDSTGMPGDSIPLDDPEGINVCRTIDAAPTHETLRPASFKLYQNYPNPFNPTTNIQFDLTRDARVSLKIYNVLGQQVATLFDNRWMSAGVQTARFDASNLASGVYIYRLNIAGGHTESLKMVVLK